MVSMENVSKMENTPRKVFHMTKIPDVGFKVSTPYDLDYDPDAPKQPKQPRSFAPTPLPDWLSATPDPADQVRLPKFPRSKERIEMEEMIFDIFFETFVDAIVTNANPLAVIRADPRGIDPGRFMRWIRRDKTRQERFEEAQEIASELLVYQNDDIAEGADSMEDIERSKLRLKQNEFKIKSWNKRRYGDSKQVDINMNNVIDMRALLDKRDNQLRTLEGEYATMIDIPALVGANG